MFYKTKAYFVHVLTGLGIFLSFFSIISILSENLLFALIFLLIALFIDIVDGSLARQFEVKKHIPNLDGRMLDSIIDFINFVFIPCIILYEFDYLPEPFNIILPLLILGVSIYSFSSIKVYTKEHLYVGFPSIWNVLVIYLTILGLSNMENLYVLVFFLILKIIPIKVLHPMRYENHKIKNMIIVLFLIPTTFVLLLNSLNIQFLIELKSYFSIMWYLFNLYFIILTVIINIKFSIYKNFLK